MDFSSRELQVAIKAVAHAADLCTLVQSERDRIISTEKDDRSPVTMADLGSQALITAFLIQDFPDIPITAEEGAEAISGNESLARKTLDLFVGREDVHVREMDDLEKLLSHGNHPGGASGRFWTIDPIDGTKGFLRGEQYAVALALIEDGKPVLGVLGCPNLPYTPSAAESGFLGGSIFSAAAGHGAMVTGHTSADEPHKGHRIHVSRSTKVHHFRFCESVESAHAGHDQHAKIAAGLGVDTEGVRMDSQAKYAAVATGQAEIYLRLPSPAKPDYREKIWDHAAGALIVEEAGGKVTDADGKALDFSQGTTLAQNRGVIASHGPAHERLVELVAETG